MAKRFYKESELVFAEKPKHGSFKDLEGQKFGRLTVIGYGRCGKNASYWFCKCDCGNILNTQAPSLVTGKTKSCGCLCIELLKKRSTIHGHSKKGQVSTTFYVWVNMLKRCQNPKSHKYPDYGGRGITVCERWQKFENFLADMGEKPEGKTLDRIENNEGYYKENCRWATGTEQGNNKRNNVNLTFNGKTQTAANWGRELGVRCSVISNRIKMGWTVERALTTRR